MNQYPYQYQNHYQVSSWQPKSAASTAKGTDSDKENKVATPTTSSSFGTSQAPSSSQQPSTQSSIPYMTAQAEADRRRADPQTYTQDIMNGLGVKDLTTVTEFMSDFNHRLVEYERDFAQRHLQEYKHDLGQHYAALVPSEVAHKTFLQRYFFRCGNLERIQDDLDKQEKQREAERQRLQQEKLIERQRLEQEREERQRQQQEKLQLERQKWGVVPTMMMTLTATTPNEKDKDQEKPRGKDGSGVQFRGVSNDDPSKRAAWDVSEGAKINAKSLLPPSAVQRQATKEWSEVQRQQQQDEEKQRNKSNIKPVLRNWLRMEPASQEENNNDKNDNETDKNTSGSRPSWYDAGGRNSLRTAPMVQPQRQVTGTRPPFSSESSNSTSLIGDDNEDDDSNDDEETNFEHQRQAKHMSLGSHEAAPAPAAVTATIPTATRGPPVTVSTIARRTMGRDSNAAAVPPPVRSNSARDLISKLERTSSHSTINSMPVTAPPPSTRSGGSSWMSRLSLRGASSHGESTTTSMKATATEPKDNHHQGVEKIVHSTSTSNTITPSAPPLAKASPRRGGVRYTRSSSFKYRNQGGTTTTSEHENASVVTAPAREITISKPTTAATTTKAAAPAASVVPSSSSRSVVSAAPGVVSSRLQGMYRHRKTRSTSVTPSIGSRGGTSGGGGGGGSRPHRQLLKPSHSNDSLSGMRNSVRSISGMTASVGDAASATGGGGDGGALNNASVSSLNHTAGGGAGGTPAEPLAVKCVVRANRRQQTTETYTTPLEDQQNEDRDIKPYLQTFRMEQWKDAAAIALAMYPDSVAVHHQDLVVDTMGTFGGDDDYLSVKESDFWCRYFYRCDEKRILKDLRRKDKLGILGQSSRNLFGGGKGDGAGGPPMTMDSPIGMRIPMRFNGESETSTMNNSKGNRNNTDGDDNDNDSTRATKNVGPSKPRVGSLKDKLKNWSKITNASNGNGVAKGSGGGNNTSAATGSTNGGAGTSVSSSVDRIRRYRGRPVGSSSARKGSTTVTTPGGVVRPPSRSQSLPYGAQPPKVLVRS